MPFDPSSAVLEFDPSSAKEEAPAFDLESAKIEEPSASPSARAVALAPGQTMGTVTGTTQAIPQMAPAREQAIDALQKPRPVAPAPEPTEEQQRAMLTGIAQPESEIQPIGKPGTLLRGASSVAAGILNQPEYLAALLNPATTAAVGARFAPEIAKQFFEDLGKAAQGDNEALGRAAVIGIPALVGGVKAGRTMTERLIAKAALDAAQKASSAAHIDALARLEAAPRPQESPQPLLPLSKAALESTTTEPAPPGVVAEPSTLVKPIEERTPDARDIKTAADENGNLLPPPGESAGQVPVAQGEPRVQLQTEGGIPKETVAPETLPPESSAGKEVPAGAEATTEPASQVETPGATQVEGMFDVAKNWVKPQSDVLKGFLASRMDAYDRWKATKGKARQAAKAVLDAADRELEQAKQVHHDAVEQAYNEGKPVPPDVLSDYPDLENLMPTKALAPSQASAKVETQVQEVARTEGQRPAREVKNELIRRIEEAMKGAPEASDWSASEHGYVEINIPGDGNFRIARNLKALGEVRDAAKRLKTTSTEPTAKVTPDRRLAAEIIRKDVQDAVTVYGDESTAYQRLTSQLERASELGIEEPQQKRLAKLVSELEKRVEAPWESAKNRLQIMERDIETNRKAGLLGKVAEQEKLANNLRREVAAELAKVEQVLGRKPWETRKPSPQIIGMGGATPEEFNRPGTIVSNMFAAIDQDRAALGKPPMEPGTPRTWSQDQATAMARMNRDPQWIPDLIKEVLEKPRPLRSDEHAGMVMQKAFWKAEANNALRRISQAFDDGREADLVQAKMDAARFEDNLEQMDRAVGRGGTGSEAGRTLQAQKMGLTDDLSLVEMRLEMRGKVGGRKLTEPESAAIEKLHKEYQDKLAAVEKTASESERRRVEAETRATLAELGRQAAQAKVPPPHIQRIVDRVGSAIHKGAQDARARLKGKLFTIGDPELLLDLARIGADNIWTIGEDFARWSIKMAEDIGEHVKPHLAQIWEASKKLINDITDVESGAKTASGKKTAATVKETIKKGDTPEQKIGKLTDRIRDRATNGKKQPLTPAIQALARSLLESGIKGRDELVNAVHEIIAPLIPDWDLYKTKQAISGYGDYRTLSKDEISVELRDIKGQLQQMLKLEDMAFGKAPLRSGVEQREVTKAQQDLVKLVNEAKRKGGYETTDPATQLRTALDEVKKRTQTAIDEYERRIREKDYAVRKLQPIKPDSELINKQAELKRVRKQWEQMKRDKELTDRAQWRKALDKFVRWERAFKLSSPVVFGKLGAAAITRVVTTAAEEVVGAGLGLAPGIRTLAKQAPREGGINVPAMAKAMASAITKGMADAAQTARKGAADIDVVYGEKLVDKDWANFFGQLHGMMKAPIKRFEFELSLAKRIESNLKNGVDVTDKLVMTRLMTEALGDGYRSIFMQHGFSSDMFNTTVGIMERSKKYPVAGEISARVLRFLLPVVRVPANIVAETATGIYGAPMALARTMTAAVRGTLGSLDPVVADSIMRQWKKGSIGLGLMAIGYFNPQIFGGLDWREKRQAGGPKTAGIQIGGVDIPRWATHAPWFELMQLGATVRHVKDQHVSKTGETKGIPEGLWAAGLGLVEETPFVNEMLHADKLFNPSQRDQFLGEMARGTLVPQLIQQTAALTDRSGVQRKPKTVMQNLEMGIPGLRQNVPLKTDKKAPLAAYP